MMPSGPPYGYSYDETFFKYIRAGSSRAARVLAPFVSRELGVQSVLDVGCGAGAWIAEYLEAGLECCIGVDGEYVTADSLLIPIDNFLAQNIALPFTLDRRFDLVQCLEVGEHVTAAASATLVENLVRHGDKVMFAAAPPGQGGENHINEQPYEFWRKLFAQHGYRPFDVIRPLLKTKDDVEPWYRYNIMLYIAESAIPSLSERVRRTRIADDVPIADVSSLSYKIRKQILRRLSPAMTSRLAVFKHQSVLAFRSDSSQISQEVNAQTDSIAVESHTPGSIRNVEDHAQSVSRRLRVPELAIVVPCFNEEEVLPETTSRLLQVVNRLLGTGSIREASSIYFIDDGSADETWLTIEKLAEMNRRVHGIKLSRNHGHQNALMAGLLRVPGDAIVSVDADLQDDVSAIGEMVDAYAAGSEIVYGVRRRRPTDTLLKRFTAHSYYRLLQLMGVKVIFDHADYRLMSRRAVDALGEYGEANLFLRGLIPQLGFNSSVVYYDRNERVAGQSKYPLRRMLALAFEGISSFSAVPLKLITMLGMLISLISMALGGWAFWVKLVNPAAVPGWASTVIPVYILGGAQLFCTGIVGQYLAKVYLETKRRPRFIIEKIL